MKAKVTKPDGTVVELEGEALELVIFLPDLKGFELPKFQPISIPTPFEVVDCTCYLPWLGITPPPPCPIHGGGVIRWTVTSNTTDELEFSP